MSVLIRAVATFGFTGYFPIAPATFASAVFCAIYYLVPGGEWLAHPAVLVATLVVSIPVSTWMEKERGKDPGCVVIDEVVGMQVALTLAGDVTLRGVVAAFVLFRIFDIAKPFPVGRSQRLPGGWGIVIDDFLAGLYTRAGLVLLTLVWPGLGRFGW